MGEVKMEQIIERKIEEVENSCNILDGDKKVVKY